MPRLTKADAALRGVIVGKASLKSKLEALAGMESPSETFLLELVSSAETHSKLKLRATECLKTIRHTQEVDRILAEECLRLGLGNPVAAGSEKPLAEPVLKPDVPRTDTLAVAPLLAESPVEPTRTDALIVSEEPVTSTTPAPAPSVGLTEHLQSRPMSADPIPIFNLPRGAYLERDEQTRLVKLFHIVADKGKSESERNGARIQLDRTLAMADAGRSMFAIYLLAMLEWLERNPEQQIPNAMADNSPVMESDRDYEAFTLTFSVNQWLRQQAEEDRARRQIERANVENKGGGMWDGLPAI
jgi:hypothetical protein